MPACMGSANLIRQGQHLELSAAVGVLGDRCFDSLVAADGYVLSAAYPDSFGIARHLAVPRSVPAVLEEKICCLGQCPSNVPLNGALAKLAQLCNGLWTLVSSLAWHADVLPDELIQCCRYRDHTRCCAVSLAERH